MQPTTTIDTTAALGVDAPDLDVHEMYELLTDENKEAINLLIERLIAEQS
jgi:hypothetical protein